MKSSFGMLVKRVFASPAMKCVALVLVAVMFVTPIGCTSADVQKAVSEVDAYLPTAIQLAQIVITAIGAAQSQGASSELSSVGGTIVSDLNELKTLCDAYLAKPSDTAWQNIQNLLETIISADQQALEGAVGIKSQDAKSAYIAAITGLSAALAVIDGYINTTKTPAQLKAKAAARSAKLSAQLKYWNKADEQIVARGLGRDFNSVKAQALAYGF